MAEPNGKRRLSAPVRAGGLLAVLEASFANALRTPEGTAEPVALLWTDADGQWEPLLAQLRTLVPHIFTLGDYVPQSRTGPAIWLRCVIDRSIPEMAPPVGIVPVIYLPRVTRQELRAPEDCPRALQALVELQYRGRVWHQRNARDWTVEAFLVSEDGLGLEVAQDARTREALLRALPLLVEVPVESLRGHRLDADDFDRLAVSDPVRDLLRWIAAGDASRPGDDEARSRAFCNVCRSEFAFDPDKKTPLDAAGAMAEGTGKWADVWQRFCEAPMLYPTISTLLREVPMERFSLFTRKRSPCVNDEAERQLRSDLEAATRMPHGKAIDAVLALDAEHAKRREGVWAQLGESPLALALEPLARLAALARKPLGGATLAAVLESYATDGWRCDRAALESVASTRSQASAAVVRGAVKALYEPWLDATARHFQSLLASTEDASRTLVTGTVHEKDVCVLFVDGLRYDVAGLLQERLEARGFGVRLAYRLAPLPTVTATAKPLASPVHDALDGDASSEDFTPRFKVTGQPATALRLRENMAKCAVDVLGSDARPPSAGTLSGWVEAGRLDELGHKLGAGLAAQLDTEIEALVDRIVGLVENGWLRVRVVTDHGWLLLPGGLPKLELPSHLVATKWARCAVVRGESRPSMPVYGWHWHPEVRIASPPGIACFTTSNEYAHGGLSLQECVVPDILVERGAGAASATITSAQWRGMRCRVSVQTNDPMVRVDLRLNWKQPATSVAASVKEVGFAGEASIAVSDDANEGAAATVVLLDTAGNVLDRKPTTIGETS